MSRSDMSKTDVKNACTPATPRSPAYLFNTTAHVGFQQSLRWPVTTFLLDVILTAKRLEPFMIQWAVAELLRTDDFTGQAVHIPSATGTHLLNYYAGLSVFIL